MREIKFRAWSRKDKKMFEVYEIGFRQNEISGIWIHGVSGETGRLPLESCDLMQFTGLLDRNGQEIL